MKRIFASPNLAEVHHAKNLLEATGIRTLLKNEMLASALGQLPFAECQPELWIADDADLETAQRLLTEGPLPPEERCDLWQCVCGEIAEAQFTQCWHCARYRSS